MPISGTELCLYIKKFLKGIQEELLDGYQGPGVTLKMTKDQRTWRIKGCSNG